MGSAITCIIIGLVIYFLVKSVESKRGSRVVHEDFSDLPKPNVGVLAATIDCFSKDAYIAYSYRESAESIFASLKDRMAFRRIGSTECRVEFNDYRKIYINGMDSFNTCHLIESKAHNFAAAVFPIVVTRGDQSPEEWEAYTWLISAFCVDMKNLSIPNVVTEKYR
jgi:hypothetical protein